MASLYHEVKVYRLSPDATMTIKIIPTAQFKLRTWLAEILMRMAAICLGCGIQIEEDGKDVT